MRHSYLTCLLFVAACGDNNEARVDAPRPDGPTADAPPDTAVDAPPDGPMTPLDSRVWVVGDVLVNNTNLAAAFTHGMGTLPFGPENEPPIRIADLIPNLSPFDARGAKIAYAVTVPGMPGVLEVRVADADGSNPIVVFQGGGTNVEIGSVALSPDGTKVAFTMDSTALNNGIDLYVAPTTAGATPVRVSPDRPMGAPTPDQQDVGTDYTWSADSKYIAFRGDFTENNADQVYLVDTSVTPPTTIELLARADIATQSGTQGARGAPQFDSANNIYFRARVQAGTNQFQFFRATPAGARTMIALPARGDTSVPDIGSFAISPAGDKLVFSADAPTLGQYDVYVADTATLTPTKVTALAAAGSASFFAPIEFSPDATKIAVVGNFLAAASEPYVIHLDGSTPAPRRLVAVADTCPGCANVNADSVQWTADGAAIYVRGDLASENDTRVFRVDPTMANQAPTLAVTTPVSGDITALLVRPIP